MDLFYHLLKKDDEFSILGDSFIFPLTCNCVWLCDSQKIHIR